MHVFRRCDFDVYGRFVYYESSARSYLKSSCSCRGSSTAWVYDQMLSKQVIQRIAEENRQNSVSSSQYQMLDTEFFWSAYKEARGNTRLG